MRVRRLPAACAGVLLAVPGMAAAPAQAETNPSCGSVEQIGTTAYLKATGGQTFASVKQFKGCNKDWGYVFVWEKWRTDHPSTNYSICAAVAVGSAAPYDYKGSTVCTPTGRRVEVWSKGTDTLTQCTRGYGVANISENSAFTSVRC